MTIDATECLNLIKDPKARLTIPILVGPTASGKSTLALALAKSLPIEIISVDSALVYRGMDIGTAKPTLDERLTVPHHLIDMIDPTQSYSAAQFCRDALRLIPDILSRQRLPVLVGGTMLYIKALVDGLDELPPVNLDIRYALDAELKQRGHQALYDRLVQLDAKTASRLKVSDTQRILRALEVCLDTGKPFSSFHQQALKSESPYHFVICSLEQFERADLHQRIARRLEQMFASGFIDEVIGLKARGDLSLDLPSMRCVGYRQVWEYLDGRYDEQQMRDKSLYATRQLAKRQYTWLRAMPTRYVLDPAGDQMLTLCQQFFQHLIAIS